MLNTKDIRKNIMQLFVDKPDEPYVVGNGILPSNKIGFSERKLEESKQKIAKFLQELGIDECALISLSSLTTLKNGEVWNQLKTMEDFQALELLLACSDACGFIHNGVSTAERNMDEIGNRNSLLISSFGRYMFRDDNKWLESIRKVIIDKMHFFINSEDIKFFALGNQELPVEVARLHR